MAGNTVLIMGKPSTGKSASLMNLKEKEKWIYLNADLKELPFEAKFGDNVEIKDASMMSQYIASIEAESHLKGGILDTITFLMSMYEQQFVVGAANGQAAWGNYGNFYRNFIHQIKSGTKDYAILAHEQSVLNEQTSQLESSVPIKGAVGKVGIEADFTTILSCKCLPIRKLEGIENSLLNITKEEIEDGQKRVFATRTNKEMVGDKTRSAMGLWKRKKGEDELYIDNDLDQVFTRLKEYYG